MAKGEAQPMSGVNLLRPGSMGPLSWATNQEKVESMPGKMIFEKIPLVMADISAVGKERRNTQQSYNFRGIDDVYNAIHTVLAKHGVFTSPEVLEMTSEERQSKGGGILVWRKLKIKYTFYASDGSSFDTVVIGEAMDSGDKASNKAMSVAHKYALIQVLCIPTVEEKDPEVDSPEPAAKEPVKLYDPSLPAAKRWLDGELNIHKVPAHLWDDISRIMTGRPKTALAETIDTVAGLNG